MRDLTGFDLSREGFAPKERNDCAVRTLAAMGDVPYAVAWYTLNDVTKRKSRCGTPTIRLHKYLDSLYEKIPVEGLNVAQILAQHKERIAVSIKEHIFCAENGEPISDRDSWYERAEVIAAWRKRS